MKFTALFLLGMLLRLSTIVQEAGTLAATLVAQNMVLSERKRCLEQRQMMNERPDNDRRYAQRARAAKKPL